MIAAMKEAEKLNSIFVYGDRHINQTLQDLRQAINPTMLLKAMTTRSPPEIESILTDVFVNSSRGDGADTSIENLGSRLNC